VYEIDPNGRRIIETDLGGGRSTYVSYGWSVDYSDAAERLRREIEKLPEVKAYRRQQQQQQQQQQEPQQPSRPRRKQAKK
jgi:hypothetical protein